MRPLARSTSRWSIPTSPNSLMMTAVAAISGCLTMWLRTVVLPLPRNPVSKVTGVRDAASIAVRAMPRASNRRLHLGCGLVGEMRHHLGGEQFELFQAQRLWNANRKADRHAVEPGIALFDMLQ